MHFVYIKFGTDIDKNIRYWGIPNFVPGSYYSKNDGQLLFSFLSTSVLVSASVFDLSSAFEMERSLLTSLLR